MNHSRIILAAASLLSLSIASTATANPMVGGAAMYSSRNIVQNAVNSKDHTTLVAAVKAGGSTRCRARVRSRSSLRRTKRSRSCRPERSTIW